MVTFRLLTTVIVFLFTIVYPCSSSEVKEIHRKVTITGTINQPADDVASNLSVVVVCGATGSLLETAPVIARSRFTLHRTGEKTGRHHLRVTGSVAREYSTIIATISDNSLIATFSRFLPEHAQTLPMDHISEDIQQKNTNSEKEPRLHFIPLRRTAFRKKRKRGSGFWYFALFIPRMLWRNKMYVLGTLGLVFIVWFPHIVQKLPPDMREELTGEKETNLGDPNKLIKTLLGDEAFSVNSDQRILANGSR